jgi:hypothetical protein
MTRDKCSYFIKQLQLSPAWLDGDLPRTSTIWMACRRCDHHDVTITIGEPPLLVEASRDRSAMDAYNTSPITINRDDWHAYHGDNDLGEILELDENREPDDPRCSTCGNRMPSGSCFLCNDPREHKKQVLKHFFGDDIFD